MFEVAPIDELSQNILIASEKMTVDIVCFFSIDIFNI